MLLWKTVKWFHRIQIFHKDILRFSIKISLQKAALSNAICKFISWVVLEGIQTPLLFSALLYTDLAFSVSTAIYLLQWIDKFNFDDLSIIFVLLVYLWIYNTTYEKRCFNTSLVCWIARRWTLIIYLSLRFFGLVKIWHIQS